MRLEDSIGRPQADLATLQPLFRDFHSLKGISAIVGLSSAEQLAHRTEDYLRDLTRGKTLLSAEGLELMMCSAHALEETVKAFRDRRPVPEHPALMEALRGIAGAAPSVQATESPAQTLYDEARSRGLVVWRCTFSPSRERDERGVNINSVRARLSGAGEILSSVPQILGQGQIAFDFIVGMKETPPDIAAWEADGLVAELIDITSSDTAFPMLADDQDALHNPFIAPSHVVRVDLPRLDELMRIVGELIVQRSRLEALLAQANKTKGSLRIPALEEVNTSMGRGLRDLREAITRVRLVSVAEIFARMPFVVRDLARDSGKTVRLKLEGQQTEIDKYLIEQLKDPLLHLVRNAFSHGVETPEERRAAGKPEEAAISLTARAMGDTVAIAVEDDGRGVNRAAVKARALEAGIKVSDLHDNAELLRILCTPGFSTRDEADRASGRGVGMAVVLSTVRQLGGTLSLDTHEGTGTEFTIRLPLTLSIAETIIVSADQQICAVPQSIVTEVIQVAATDVRRLNGVEVIPYRSGVLPVTRLSSMFRLPENGVERPSVLVLESDRGCAGLIVDRVHGSKEVVVRAMRDPLIQVAGVSGATELGDGKPVLILDGTAFTSGAVRPPIETSDGGMN